MIMEYDWVGVDYGSKLAGTTVICYAYDSHLLIKQSQKKEDADTWLHSEISNIGFSDIYFDAPLSLPGAYFGKGDNYFYRLCDRECGAMSPMFLGGLTARAMKLKANMPRYKFSETYPGYLAKKVLMLSEIYLKKKKYEGQLDHFLKKTLPLPLTHLPSNWHQVDAILCWISGWRAYRDEALVIGDIEEGVIVV